MRPPCFDAASMLFDNPMGYRKAQTASFADIFGREEGIKNFADILRRDA